MFKNHALQVKMVRPEKIEAPEIDQIEQLDEKAAIISVHLERAVKMVVSGVLTYIVADTVRQVIVKHA